eukprot:scaffold35109_cov69-Phaeocystis_antarctica.AAC.3
MDNTVQRRRHQAQAHRVRARRPVCRLLCCHSRPAAAHSAIPCALQVVGLHLLLLGFGPQVTHRVRSNIS